MKKSNKITPRVFFIMFILMVLYITVILYLIYLQVFKHKIFKKLSNQNMCKIRQVYSARGNILDINNNIIVGNHKRFRLVVMMKNKKNIKDLIDNIQDVFQIDNNIINRKIKQNHFAVLKIFKNLDELNFWKTNETIERNVIVEEFWYRNNIYPYFNNITGYIQYDPVFNTETPIKGIEKSFNKSLEGRIVQHNIYVDTQQNVVDHIQQEKYKKGEDLKTTLFIEAHEFLNELLKDKNAGVVVLNEKGEVLVNFSSPYLYVYDDIENVKKNCFINKTMQEKYPAGSIFKLISLLTLFDIEFPIKQIVCTGGVSVGSHVFHCWKKKGHGLLKTTEEVIKYSCNSFFYIHCLTMEPFLSRFFFNLDELGYNTRTQNIIQEEIDSKIKKPNNKTQMMMMSIGQGYTTTTIIQNCLMILRLMTGKKINPSFTPVGDNVVFEKLNLNEENRKRVSEHVFRTFEPGGTCGARNIPGRVFFGKTSTAQVMSLKKSGYKREHSIFIGGEAKYNLYISVLVENAGFGSATAGAIGTKLLDFIIKNLFEKK